MGSARLVCTLVAAVLVSVMLILTLAQLPRHMDAPPTAALHHGASSPPARASTPPLNRTACAILRSLRLTNRTRVKGRDELASCFDTADVVRRWRAARPRQHRPWVVANIGANKAYAAAGIVAALGTEPTGSASAFTVAAVGAALMRRVLNDAPCAARIDVCGACCDCVEDTQPLSARSETVAPREPDPWHLYAYEAQPANAAWLRGYVSQHPPPPGCRVHVRHAAVGATLGGTVAFASGALGVETGAVCATTGPAGDTPRCVQVPQTTLDHELAGAVEHVDVLLTDTEGHDYQVGAGARALLSAGRVGLYTFEAKGRDRTLRQHVAMLEAFRYACYAPLQPLKPYAQTLLRISAAPAADCWHAGLDEPTWGNVVCAHASQPELLDVLEGMAAEPVSPRRYAGALCYSAPEVEAAFVARYGQAAWDRTDRSCGDGV